MLKTSCCIEETLKFLKDLDVTISDDAGRFVCNYVYYQSLCFAEQKGHKSLFVHVPLFSRIDEETQMHFVASLLEAIASTCYWYECLFEHFLFVCHLLVHVNHLCQYQSSCKTSTCMNFVVCYLFICGPSYSKQVINM